MLDKKTVLRGCVVSGLVVGLASGCTGAPAPVGIPAEVPQATVTVTATASASASGSDAEFPFQREWQKVLQFMADVAGEGAITSFSANVAKAEPHADGTVTLTIDKVERTGIIDPYGERPLYDNPEKKWETLTLDNQLIITNQYNEYKPLAVDELATYLSDYGHSPRDDFYPVFTFYKVGKRIVAMTEDYLP